MRRIWPGCRVDRGRPERDLFWKSPKLKQLNRQTMTISTLALIMLRKIGEGRLLRFWKSLCIIQHPWNHQASNPKERNCIVERDLSSRIGQCMYKISTIEPVRKEACRQRKVRLVKWVIGKNLRLPEENRPENQAKIRRLERIRWTQIYSITVPEADKWWEQTTESEFIKCWKKGSSQTNSRWMPPEALSRSAIIFEMQKMGMLY